MDRKEICDLAQEWQDKDKENRSVIIIMTEMKGEANMGSSTGIAGVGKNLIVSLCTALDNDEDLLHMVKKAIKNVETVKLLKQVAKSDIDIKEFANKEE